MDTYLEGFFSASDVSIIEERFIRYLFAAASSDVPSMFSSIPIFLALLQLLPSYVTAANGSCPHIGNITNNNPVNDHL